MANRRWLVCFIGYFMLVALSNAQDIGLLGEEGGTCPEVPVRECPPKPVQEICLIDADCPEREQKCCSDGCKLVCMKVNATVKKEVCAVPVDLGFVIDASGSIGAVNFQKILQFVAQIVDAFDIRENGTRVGVIYYSDDAKVAFDFNKFKGDQLNKENVVKEINKISVTEGQTRIDLALRLAKKSLFSLEGGMRPDKPKIALVMTDGRQTKGLDAPDAEDLHIASRPLKDLGVQVYSLGIGNDYDIGELLDIASDDASVFRSTDVDELVSIVASITEQTCKGCTNPLDIHFALDSSANVGEENFEMMKNFIKAVGYKFIISEKGSHISASVFGDEATLVFNMSKATSQDDFITEADTIPYLGEGGTSIDKVLRLAQNEVFTLEGFSRQNVAKVFVLLTGSNCDTCKEKLEEAVKPLKAAGVHLIIIPIGTRLNLNELQTISSLPSSQFVIPQQSFTELLNGIFIQRVSEMICSGKPGVCVEPPIPKNCEKIAYNCDVDVDCPSGKKCCLKGCEQKCEAPVTACIAPLDLAFAFETTQDGEADFEKMKFFASDLLDHFKIKSSGTHVSLSTFSDKPNRVSKFSSSYNAEVIKSQIKGLKSDGGSKSNIGTLLGYAGKDVYNIQSGARQSQPRVLVIFTKGKFPQEQEVFALEEARKLKEEGQDVQIIVVNMGQSLQKELLENIVSKPSSAKLITIESDDDLISSEKKQNIAEQVCSAKTRKRECKEKFFEVCSVRDNLCESDFDCPGFEECASDGCRLRCTYCGKRCDDKLDILLMLDDSAKVGAEAFQKTKNFAKTMMEWFNINQNGTNVAVMTYSDKAKVHMHLPLPGTNDPPQTLFDIQGSLDSVPYTGGITSKLDVALGTAAAQVFPSSGKKRAKRAVIIFSDGKDDSSSRLEVASWPLRSQRQDGDSSYSAVRIMAVTVGDQINVDALEKVVTPPLNDNVFVAAGFDDMYNAMRKLAEESCIPLAGNLKPPNITRPGPPGPPGPPGEKGEKGMSGPDGKGGKIGIKGEPGMKGEKGMDGDKGPPGGFGDGPDGSNTKGPDPEAGAVGVIEGEAVPGPGNIIYDMRKGPVGPPGASGDVGSAGDSGDDGKAGKPGRDGPAGPRGFFGNPGQKGESGTDGTPGAPGEQGPQGKLGRPGQPGGRGIPGPQGPFGWKGQQGIGGGEGDLGDKGQKGPKGYSGEKGGQGDLGPSGYPGEEGPEGPVGPPGQRGLRGPDGKEGEFGPNGLIGGKGQPGPRGNRGGKGESGSMGGRGVKGGVGDEGPQGEQGPIGGTGAPGEDGQAGQTGPDGPPGLPGQVGPVGPAGQRGEIGPAGGDGQPGLLGPKGARGENGRRGVSGVKGETGDQGEPGLKGPLGQQGTQGKTGSAGPRGRPGVAGGQGRQGQPGDPGQTGRVGAKGNQGLPGKQGPLGNPGSRGYTGLSGAKGFPGDSGSVGKPGVAGRDGKHGQTGLSGKDGDKGVQGAQGLQGLPGSMGTGGINGEPGETGDSGQKGADGAKGFRGESGARGAPGVVGQPGETGAIGSAGEPGSPGTAGIQGPSGPRGETGLIGLDGLIGAKGSAGRPGNPGHIGDQGTPGTAGLPGTPGVRGKPGGRGDPGTDGGQGDTGVPGTPGLTGVRGSQGPDGPTGQPGNQGRKGARGLPGINGKKGQDGNAGSRGPSGLAGARGLPGTRGAIGPDGNPGLDGNPGPVGEVGKTGKPGVPGLPGPSGLRGPNGPPGPRGAKGPVGDRGDSGEVGPDGDAGVAGQTGLVGRRGEKGLTGNIGPIGEIGAMGMPGVQGPPGTIGPDGPLGPPGVAGKTGNKGPLGEPGNPGKPGTPGDQGPLGKDGTDGNPGTPGKQGVQGLVGPIGPQGPPGQQGLRGRPGKKGRTGKDGLKGFPGPNGHPGLAGKRGTRGKEGPTGTEGLAGRNGRDGKPGNNGADGSLGAQGPKGELGDRGDNGAPGGLGDSGDTGGPGPEGPTGFVGLTGGNGNSGKQGKRGGRGDRGDKGPNGKKGISGRNGSRGRKGTMGRYGMQGPPGDTGEKGDDGPDGPMGHSGPQGNSGETGPDGKEGVTGEKGLTGNDGPRGSIGRIGLPGDSGTPGTAGPAGPPGPSGPPGDVSGALAGNFWDYINAGGGQKGPPGGRSSRKRRSVDDKEFDQNDIPTVLKKHYEVLKNFDNLWNTVINDIVVKKKLGSRSNPAITCAELFRTNPDKTSSDYWIDPNEGSPDDAILVHCNATSFETCIYPKLSVFDKDDWYNGNDRYMWAYKDLLAEKEGILYASDVVQLKMMRLLSTRCRQNITYHCKNSHSDVRVKTDNNRVMDVKKASTLHTLIIKDECMVKDGKWHESVFEMSSRKLEYFPLQDVAVKDIGDKGEEFGMEIGPVCFT